MNIKYTLKEMLKHCLEIYQSKSYKLHDNIFLDLYDLYNQELGLIKNFNMTISEFSCDTFSIKRNNLTEIAIFIHFQNYSTIVHVNIEDTLKVLLDKINKKNTFPMIFTKENSLFSSKIHSSRSESECDLDLDFQIRFLPSDMLYLKNKMYLDSPQESKPINEGEFIINLIDKKSKSSKRLLLITNTFIKIKKLAKDDKKTFINKIKMLIKKNDNQLDISVHDIVGIKRIERANCLEITFKIKRKSKFIIIEAESSNHREKIYLDILPLINPQKFTV